ncbi:MAG: hypothetical protein ACMXYK_04075 [Candidatus Woesearchaeota archaeon]
MQTTHFFDNPQVLLEYQPFGILASLSPFLQSFHQLQEQNQQQ